MRIVFEKHRRLIYKIEKLRLFRGFFRDSSLASYVALLKPGKLIVESLSGERVLEIPSNALSVAFVGDRILLAGDVIEEYDLRGRKIKEYPYKAKKIKASGEKRLAILDDGILVGSRYMPMNIIDADLYGDLLAIALEDRVLVMKNSTRLFSIDAEARSVAIRNRVLIAKRDRVEEYSLSGALLNTIEASRPKQVGFFYDEPVILDSRGLRIANRHINVEARSFSIYRDHALINAVDRSILLRLLSIGLRERSIVEIEAKSSKISTEAKLEALARLLRAYRERPVESIEEAESLGIIIDFLRLLLSNRLIEQSASDEFYSLVPPERPLEAYEVEIEDIEPLAEEVAKSIRETLKKLIGYSSDELLEALCREILSKL